MELLKHDRCVRLEDPLAGWHFRPRRGHTRSTETPPEQHAHPQISAAAKSDVFERDADFHRPPVSAYMSGTLPHPVGREILAVTPALERVHLDAVRVHEQVIRQLARAARVEAQTDP